MTKSLLCLGLSIFLYAPQADAPPATPQEPVSGILDAFRTHSIVAMADGRSHGDQAGLDFRIGLLNNPQFLATVDDVVLEAGNARFQTQIDRYVRGEIELSQAELQQPWNDSTQPQLAINTLSAADQFLVAIRRANATQPRGRWLRALLSDPPIDWSTVQSASDHRGWIEQRDRFAADLIEREVLARNRRALIIYGGGHLQRINQQANYDMSNPLAHTLASLLESRMTSPLFVIRSEYEFPDLQPDIATWPIPSLSLIAGTRLGAVAEPSIGISRARLLNDGQVTMVPRDQWTSRPLEQQMDAILYLGSLTTITNAPMSKARCTDTTYIETQIGRMTLAGVPRPEIDGLRRTCAQP